MRSRIINHNIAWEVTDSCNHHCFYCYNHFVGNEDIGTNAADYDKIAKKILSLQPVSVAITGGEPLLVYDKIKGSIEEFSSEHIFIRLLTNGTLITDEIACFLKKHNVQVMVSFPVNDSALYQKITGENSYERVLRGLDSLQKYHVDFLINVVVNSLNLTHMETVADFLIKKYKLSTLYFSRTTKPSGTGKGIEEQLLDNDQLNCFFDKCLQIRKTYGITVKTCGGYAYCSINNMEAFPMFSKGCGIEQEQSFVLGSRGDVRFCGKDNRTYGNILQEDIVDIRTKMKLQNNFSLPSECRKCKWKRSCRGGCHMSSYSQTPSFNNIDANANPRNTRINKIERPLYRPPLFKKYVLNDNVVKKIINKEIRYSYTFFPCMVPLMISKRLDAHKDISLFSVMVLSAFSFDNGYALMKELIGYQIVRAK